jgi:hypothetical protein
MQGYQLLAAALGVCLVISVGANYLTLKGGPAGAYTRPLLSST